LNPIPRSLTSSYFSIVSYPTKSSAPIAPGQNVSLTMQSVQVTSIPRRLYVFARDDDSVLTPFSSDTFMSLATNANPITLTWNNNQFLSQSTAADLYNMSVKNGINMSWSQFTNFTGSVLCIDFGTDIGLMSDEAPGILGNYQLGLTCQFTNTRSTSITPTLYAVVCYEGVFNVINGNCSHMIGILSREDVLNSQRMAGITYKAAESIWGGDFYEKLKHRLGQVHDFVKKGKIISSVAKAIPHPASQVLGSVADRFGYGMSGGSLSGGKLTKEQLKQRLQEKKYSQDAKAVGQIYNYDEDNDNENSDDNE